ncbi:hypothetical protein R3P38DRAFT_3003657 [Favolaschia claudopus]|uniref:Transposase n=1 Tax=Favolaschia claudopus TaxID=2862362 RepID=A0AAW0AL51_9AGAR
MDDSLPRNPSASAEDLRPPPNYKDFLAGPKTNILPVHGWTNDSILYNHLDENIAKVLAKPLSSMAAVILTQDRPADRAAGANAIADAIIHANLSAKDDFTVIPPTPKDGDPNSPVLPHTNLVICNSSALKDKVGDDPHKAIVHTQRDNEGFTFYILPAFPEPSWYIATYVGLSQHLTAAEFIAALFDKLVSDRQVIRMILDNHDRIPDAEDLPFTVRVMLEYAQVIPCQVVMSARRGNGPQHQNAVRLYMPPPSFNDAAIKEWKEHLNSPSFTFIVDCRGRAAPFKPTRAGKPRTMECTECLGLDHYKAECPILASPSFLAVHPRQTEQDANTVGTTLGSMKQVGTDHDGFTTVNTRTRRLMRGGYKQRGWNIRPRRF